jgi:hypothetical protein
MEKVVILVFSVVIRSENVVISSYFGVIIVDSVVKMAKSVVIKHDSDLITDDFEVTYLWAIFYETGLN